MDPVHIEEQEGDGRKIAGLWDVVAI